MKRGLSGYVPGRNILRLDYCAALAVQSLLGVCDEVIFCDSDSDDGTKELFTEWAVREPKLRVINYPWPDPVGDVMMLPKWINFTRGFCEFSSQITLDADEVLCPKSYPMVRSGAEQGKCFWFKRLNFWGDPHHIAPHNTVCAQVVVRQGPTELEMVSDGFYNPEPPIKVRAIPHPSLRIFHLGFLRKREAFYAKSKVVQRAICNTYDSRLAESEANGRPWTENCSGWKEPLINYPGTDFPPGVPEWLTERGYAP